MHTPELSNGYNIPNTIVFFFFFFKFTVYGNSTANLAKGHFKMKKNILVLTLLLNMPISGITKQNRAPLE